MNRWLKYKILLCAILFSCSTYAQHFVTGKIIDKSGQGVAAATIKFKKDSSALVKYYSISDRNGNYVLSTGREKVGVIVISAVSYIEKLIAINFKESDTISLTVQLETNLKVLPEVKINNTPSVVVSGDTISYSAENFKRGNENNVGDLLNNIPGFKVMPNGLLTYNGKIIDRVLINGDDITGAGYTKMVNNLDVNGIEQLQVIQNYLDDENIMNKIMPGKEQVLNIKYKKGFLSRIFGSIEGGTGPVPKYHNAGLQALRIFGKTKIITIGRLNSTGSLNSEPGAINLSEEMAKNPDYDIQLRQNTPPVSINDLRTGIEGLSPAYNNHSGFLTQNFLSRPTKKISIRGQFNLLYDRFHEQNNTVLTYITSPPLIVQQSNLLTRKINRVNGLLSFNYHPDAKSQIRLSIKSDAEKNRSFANTSLTGFDDFTETDTTRNWQIGIKLYYNRIVSSSSALAFSVDYNGGKLPQNYFLSPLNLGDFFAFDNSFDRLTQKDILTFNNSSVQLKFIKKVKNHTLSVAGYSRHDYEWRRNNIIAYSPQAIIQVGNDSVNNSKNKLLTTGIILQDSWQLLPGLSISGVVETQFAQSRLSNQHSGLSKKLFSQLGIYPSIDIGWQISKENRLNFSYTRSPRFFESRYLGTGFSLENITSIYRKTDSSAVNEAANLNVFYSFINLLKKKRIFVANFSFINDPQLFVRNIIPYHGIAYAEFISSNKTMQLFSLQLTGFKYSKNYKTQFIPALNVSRGSRYTVIQGVEQKIVFDLAQISIGFNTEVGKLQIKNNLKLGFQKQEYSSVFKSRQLIASSAVNWKFNKKLFADINVKYWQVDSKNRAHANYVSVAGKLLWKPVADKIELSIVATNMFNQSNFTSIILTELNQNLSTFRLFPRIVLLNVKYKF